jgi:hypothetical protein
VIAAALIVPPDGTFTPPTVAEPFFGVNVTDGTGFPSRMNQS